MVCWLAMSVDAIRHRGRSQGRRSSRPPCPSPSPWNTYRTVYNLTLNSRRQVSRAIQCREVSGTGLWQCPLRNAGDIGMGGKTGCEGFLIFGLVIQKASPVDYMHISVMQISFYSFVPNPACYISRKATLHVYQSYFLFFVAGHCIYILLEYQSLLLSSRLARTPTLRVVWKLQEPGTNLLSVYSCASGMLLALSHLRTHISSLPSAVLKASPSHQLAHYPSFIWYRSPAMLHLLLLSYPSH